MKKPFQMPLNGKSLCRQATANKTKETNKTLLLCQIRQSTGGICIVYTMAIVLEFPPESLVGLVTSYFASITVLCVLPQRKEVDTMAKRRANGEGSLRKRKDGRWEGRYTAGTDSVTGKAIVKSVLGKTQAEVKEKMKKAIAESESLDVKRSGMYTVGEWMDLWYEVYAKPRIRESTAVYYKMFIDTHIRPNRNTISTPAIPTCSPRR